MASTGVLRGHDTAPHLLYMARSLPARVTVTERWHNWNGARYRVWERPVPGSTTPPLILIHGYAACVEQWGRFIRDIGPDVPVYALDLIGFGEASKPHEAPYGREFYVAQFEHIRAAYGWQRVVPIGHSLGGMLAIEWAAHRPDTVAAVIAIAPGGLLDPENLRLWQMALLRRLERPALTRVLYGLISHLPYRLISITAYADRAAVDPVTQVAIKRALRSPGAAWSFSAVVRQQEAFFTAARHETVRCPLHLIWGMRDRQVSAKEIAALRRNFPRATLSTFHEGGHCIHEERARTVAAEVRSLLVQDGLLPAVPAPMPSRN